MIVGHIMGIPVEETVQQFAPVTAVTLTLVVVAGRAGLTRLGHRLRSRRP